MGESESSNRDKEMKKVAVVGAGRVGSTIAAAWLRAGSKVVLADIDERKLLRLSSMQPIFPDEPLIDGTLFNGLRSGKLILTQKTSAAVSMANVIIIAVPVGLRQSNADLSNLEQAAKTIGTRLQRECIVILETSVPPGTTRNFLKPILEEASGLEAGKDFMLAYSPERISEGRALKDLEENYPKVVSGFDERSLNKAAIIYSKIAKKGVIKMSSLEEAEAEKLFEGIYRDVNIALANELADFCELSGLNYWEVMNAANSQPYCHLHKPGTGVGGACIPVYPVFIYNKAVELGKEMKLTRIARQTNDEQPLSVAKKAIAFRGDVADDRLSPSYILAGELKKQGYTVQMHDPLVLPKESGSDSSNSLEEVLKGAKLVIVATDHSLYKKMKPSQIRKMTGEDAIIYDARAVLAKEGAHAWHKVLGVGAKR